MVYVIVYLLMVVITAVLFCYTADVSDDPAEAAPFVALGIFWPVYLPVFCLSMFVAFLLVRIRRLKS